MDTTTVPTGPVPNEPSVWADIAAELRKMAEDALDLIGQPGPAMFQINIQPKPWNNAEALAAVDTIASVLLGKPGETKKMGSDGICHRNADGARGPVQVSIFRQVPAPDSRDEEMARLRAENDKLRAELEATEHDGPGIDCRRCSSEGFEGVRHEADPTGLTYGRDSEVAASAQPCKPECGGGRQCRCQGGWS